MKIINKEIEIQKTDNLSSEYIEAELLKQNQITRPLRWAIVKTSKDSLTVNVVFCVD